MDLFRAIFKNTDSEDSSSSDEDDDDGDKTTVGNDGKGNLFTINIWADTDRKP